MFVSSLMFPKLDRPDVFGYGCLVLIVQSLFGGGGVVIVKCINVKDDI